MKVRIEIHLNIDDAHILETISKKENRSRKNFIENEIKKIIEEFKKNMDS